MIDGLRFLLFHGGVALITPFYTLAVLAAWPLPFAWRDEIARAWCRAILAWLRITWGVRHQVRGRENLPTGAAVILSNHQSAWETIAFRAIFPARLSWVIKRALFNVPFYGWGLKALEEIGIDRKAGRRALRQVQEQGAEHIRKGRWVVTFPEGTRMPPDSLGRFAQGGARLACTTGVPVVPVALDSGRYWPVAGWRKHPGTIRVHIGPPIDTRGRDPAEVSRLAREWIAAELGLDSRA